MRLSSRAKRSTATLGWAAAVVTASRETLSSHSLHAHSATPHQSGNVALVAKLPETKSMIPSAHRGEQRVVGTERDVINIILMPLEYQGRLRLTYPPHNDAWIIGIRHERDGIVLAVR